MPAATRVVLLPSGVDPPHLPPWLVPDPADDVTEPGEEHEPRLMPWKVTGLALEVADGRHVSSALDLLVTLPLGETLEVAPSLSKVRLGADLSYWALAAKFGLELLATQKYLPGIREDEGQFRAH